MMEDIHKRGDGSSQRALSRRRFLSLVALGVAGATASPLLMACGGQTAAQPTSAPPAGPTQSVAGFTSKVVYPEPGRTVTMIVPWAAGGGTDVGVRALVPFLEQELGVSIPILNRSGANSQVGLTELAQSKPDGYTIGATNIPGGITPYLDPDRKAAYSRKDLQQVANQVMDPSSVIVKADSPFKTFKDMLDAAKANPGQVTVATTGVLSDSHLNAVQIERDAGVRFKLAHFEGSPQVVAAIMGNHVDAAIVTPSVFASSLKNNESRILGLMQPDRIKFFPDAPTLAEQGYQIFAWSARGYCVPAGTPQEIVNKLSAAIKKGMETEEVKKKMDDLLLPQGYMDAAEYTRFWDEADIQTKQLVELAKQSR